jgi:hypothetical protein
MLLGAMSGLKITDGYHATEYNGYRATMQVEVITGIGYLDGL